MGDHDNITLIPDAIHNPSEPRHFMQIVPSPTRQIARVGATIVADSTRSVIVKEVGRGVYDPVVYFDRAGVDMATLVKIDKSTHCPLKGDTEYFDISIDGTQVSEAAWSYIEMVAGDELKELIAFDASKVTVEATP